MDQTRATLGDNKKNKQMRLLLQMLQLVYALGMDKETMIDGVPFQQYLWPV